MKSILIILFLICFKTMAHETDYKNLSKIEMDVLRNDKIIGYSNYYFEHKNNTMIVTNDTKFEVQLFGVKIFKINGSSREIYKNGKGSFFIRSNPKSIETSMVSPSTTLSIETTRKL